MPSQSDPAPFQRSDLAGLLWALLAAGLWGSLSIAGKWLLNYQIGALIMMAARASLAAIILGLVLLLTRPALLRLEQRDLPFFALYGLVSVAGNYLSYFLALQMLGATLAITLFYAYPVLATLLAALFLKESLTWRRVLPLPLTFLGCTLVAGMFSPQELAPRPAGIAWALLGALTFAIYPLFGRRGMFRYSPWTVLFYSITFGALWLSLLVAILCPLAQKGQLPSLAEFCGTLPGFTWENLAFWAGLLFLALGPTLGAYFSYLQSIRHIQVRQASLITTLELVLTSSLAVILFQERLAPAQWAGGGLILAAVLWVRLEQQPSRGRRAPQAHPPSSH